MNNAVLFIKKRSADALAISLSLMIHALIFLIIYYTSTQYKKIGGPGRPYKVELDLQSFHPSLPTLATPTAVEQAHPKKSIKNIHKKITNISQEAAPQPIAQTAEHQPSVINEEPAIDARGLYKNPNSNKRAGASLEMPGWIWDTAPHAQDSTDEIGKLLFEIIIDDTGEIIGIKTLEKTVSPLLEQLYKEAVAKLTFSKTSKELTYTATSTGKITFILQYK